MGVLGYIGSIVGGALSTWISWMSGAFSTAISDLLGIIVYGVFGQKSTGAFFYMMELPVLCSNGPNNFGVPQCTDPGLSWLPQMTSGGGALGSMAYLGSITLQVYQTMMTIIGPIFFALIFLAGLTYALEGFTIMSEGTAAKMVTGAFTAVLFIYFFPLLYDMAAIAINFFVNTTGGPSLLFNGVHPGGLDPITFLLESTFFGGSAVSSGGAAFAYVLVGLILNVIFFMLDLVLILTIIILGVLRLFLLAAFIAAFPLVVVLRLFPFLQSEMRKLLDELVGLMLSSIVAAIFLRIGVALLSCDSNSLCPSSASQTYLFYVGSISTTSHDVSMIASLSAIGILFIVAMMPQEFSGRLGAMMRQVQGTVTQAVSTGTMVAGMAVTGGMAGALGAIKGAGGMLTSGAGAAGAGAAASRVVGSSPLQGGTPGGQMSLDNFVGGSAGGASAGGASAGEADLGIGSSPAPTDLRPPPATGGTPETGEEYSASPTPVAMRAKPRLRDLAYGAFKGAALGAGVGAARGMKAHFTGQVPQVMTGLGAGATISLSSVSGHLGAWKGHGLSMQQVAQDKIGVPLEHNSIAEQHTAQWHEHILGRESVLTEQEKLAEARRLKEGAGRLSSETIGTLYGKGTGLDRINVEKIGAQIKAQIEKANLQNQEDVKKLFRIREHLFGQGAKYVVHNAGGSKTPPKTSAGAAKANAGAGQKGP